MFGNNRKGDKLMKFAGAPGEPLSLALLLLDFIFCLTTSSLTVWSSSLSALVLAADLYHKQPREHGAGRGAPAGLGKVNPARCSLGKAKGRRAGPSGPRPGFRRSRCQSPAASVKGKSSHLPMSPFHR